MVADRESENMGIVESTRPRPERAAFNFIRTGRELR